MKRLILERYYKKTNGNKNIGTLINKWEANVEAIQIPEEELDEKKLSRKVIKLTYEDLKMEIKSVKTYVSAI